MEDTSRRQVNQHIQNRARGQAFPCESSGSQAQMPRCRRPHDQANAKKNTRLARARTAGTQEDSSHTSQFWLCSRVGLFVAIRISTKFVAWPNISPSKHLCPCAAASRKCTTRQRDKSQKDTRVLMCGQYFYTCEYCNL